MRAEDITALFEELELEPVVREAYIAFFDATLAELRPDAGDAPIHSYDAQPEHLALALERLALRAEGEPGVRRRLFDEAFVCRRAVDHGGFARDAALAHFVALAADGLVAERNAELMMLLREVDVEAELALPDELPWIDELLLRICRAFILLCRKGGGWDDVRLAAEEVRYLRELQAERESPLLGEGPTPALVAQLIGRYNLAKLVDVTATYLINGTPSEPLVVLRRHKANVDAMFDIAPDPDGEHVADLLAEGATLLVGSSIWAYGQRLGEKVDAFIQQLVARDEPLLELWPSQRAALSSSLLDPAKRAVVVEMPTSAGKTLLAEFAIVQAFAMYPGRRVAYVVPTRALVNQVTRRLRHDFAPLGLTVEAAVPVLDLDATEDAFLRQPFDILVVTPEKLDLLIRSDHPSVAELSLVVADEAHNIGADQRGARLELLLAMLRRERAGTRFLLLTPFVPNGEEHERELYEATVPVGFA